MTRLAAWVAAAGVSLVVWAVYGHRRDNQPHAPMYEPDDWRHI